MSYATDYLTRMSGREVNKANGEEAFRTNLPVRLLHHSAQNGGQQGAYLSANRAAQDLLRLCLGPSAIGSQALPTQTSDTDEQKGRTI
jgi:hypothetical protein